jgi:ammonium transporter
MIDTLWLLICSLLIFLIQPGFMCLESGLTRSKNSINVAIKNLADFGLSVSLFWAVGFGLMFGTGNGWFGTTDFLVNVDQDLEIIPFFIFQAMFAGTATTIFAGAVAERLKFMGYLIVAIAVSGIIYPVFGHWIWGGVIETSSTGWLRALGFYDFGGSTVVNSLGGWVALASLIVIGSRTGKYVPGQLPNKIHGYNLPLSVLGCLFLWFGWLGFNGGSLLEFSDLVPKVIVHTLLAGVAGMIVAGILNWFKGHLIDVEALIFGSLAGLVSITASCNVVTTPIALVIGGIGGAVMTLVMFLLERWHIDDAVGAVPVHIGGGVWGTLAVGLFAQPEVLNTGLSKGHQILIQLLGIVVCFIWAFGLTWLLVNFTNRIFPLRVSLEDEDIGLNIAEHGAKTEVYDLLQIMDRQAKTDDLGLRVPVEPFTEVGHIATRYNYVMDSLEARTKLIRKTFGRYVSDEVVEQLLKSPNALELGGERKKITILTSDLRGFTAISERLEPEEVVKILNFYLQYMTKIILSYNGTIDKFIGDGILVLFGAPTSREDDAQRAIACAISMQLAMSEINQQIKAWGLPELDMGIGINTGEVVVGNIGSEQRTDYSVIGSPVNLAYRIESYSTGGQILISESTKEETEHLVKIYSETKVKPKGVKEPITIYSINGIAGKYNLFLEVQEEIFYNLPEPILFNYRILSGKHISEELFIAKITDLSRKSAKILMDSTHNCSLLEPLTNLKLNFQLPDNQYNHHDIYAKVMESNPNTLTFKIDFTSLPREITNFIKEKLSSV